MTNSLRTRKLVLIAMLAAISFILMIFPQFPLLPGADFLKIEFSILPILVGLYLFDLPAALTILVIRSLLKLLLNNEGVNTWVGLPLNIVAVGSFVMVFALFFKRNASTKTYVAGSILATVTMTVAMMIVNFVYAVPLYAKFAHFDINQIFGIWHYLLAIVLPFNLIQGVIFAISFAIIFVALKSILDRLTKKK